MVCKTLCGWVNVTLWCDNHIRFCTTQVLYNNLVPEACCSQDYWWTTVGYNLTNSFWNLFLFFLYLSVYIHSAFCSPYRTGRIILSGLASLLTDRKLISLVANKFPQLIQKKYLYHWFLSYISLQSTGLLWNIFHLDRRLNHSEWCNNGVTSYNSFIRFELSGSLSSQKLTLLKWHVIGWKHNLACESSPKLTPTWHIHCILIPLLKKLLWLWQFCWN